MATIISSLQRSMQSEHAATRKCVERIPATMYEFKPHPKSMVMGYLVHLVCDIPNWLAHMMDEDVIDLANFKKESPKTSEDMVAYLDKNITKAVAAFERLKEDRLDKPFNLVSGTQKLSTMPRVDSLTSTINHWVHHRGQLTVYMRLNNIAVPSIYGPSADETPWQK